MSDLAYDGSHAARQLHHQVAASSPQPAASYPGLAPPLSRRPANDRLVLEQVNHDADCAITVRRFDSVRFDWPWHYHPEFEVSLVLSGCGSRHVGDSIEEFGPGDLVFIGGGTPHCWLSPPAAPGAGSAIVLQFSPGVFGAGFLALLETRPLAVLMERAALGLHFDGPTRDEAAELLDSLKRSGITRLEKLSGLVSLLTVLATGGGGRPLTLTAAPPRGPRESSRAAEVLRYIREHASEPLSRTELARRAGMSLGTFSRFFIRQFGKPFVTYVAEVRVANACRLLREQDQSVGDIAYDVGFRNLANFNRTFLRLKGMTPTAYRKMARSAG